MKKLYLVLLFVHQGMYASVSRNNSLDVSKNYDQSLVVIQKKLAHLHDIKFQELQQIKLDLEEQKKRYVHDSQNIKKRIEQLNAQDIEQLDKVIKFHKSQREQERLRTFAPQAYKKAVLQALQSQSEKQIGKESYEYLAAVGDAFQSGDYDFLQKDFDKKRQERLDEIDQEIHALELRKVPFLEQITILQQDYDNMSASVDTCDQLYKQCLQISDTKVASKFKELGTRLSTRSYVQKLQESQRKQLDKQAQARLTQLRIKEEERRLSLIACAAQKNNDNKKAKQKKCSKNNRCLQKEKKQNHQDDFLDTVLSLCAQELDVCIPDLYKDAQDCLMQGGSRAIVSQAMQFVPFQRLLSQQVYDYQVSLVYLQSKDGVQEKILKFTQEQKEKLEIKKGEHAQLVQLLDRYKTLLINYETLNRQQCLQIAEELKVKDAYMRTHGEEQGLPYFIACDTQYFIAISDLVEDWQRALQVLEKKIAHIANLIQKAANQTIKDQFKIRLQEEQSKLSDWKQALLIVQSLHKENGILNPQLVLGHKTMQTLKAPCQYQYLSQESLAEIKQKMQNATNSLTACNSDLFMISFTSILEFAFEKLGIFSEQRAAVAADFVVNVASNVMSISGHLTDDIYQRLQQQYFNIFWQKNLQDGTNYSKAQMADLAKIYSALLMCCLDKQDQI